MSSGPWKKSKSRRRLSKALTKFWATHPEARRRQGIIMAAKIKAYWANRKGIRCSGVVEVEPEYVEVIRKCRYCGQIIVK